ncbi:ketopantoate reductase PanE/ApbA C terminal-domain-containing protein [Trametes gibbosa]|nr:ketopantoate reductase PanE/ApbA C terminal-domain-containing protein [Trametes gibbosa]
MRIHVVGIGAVGNFVAFHLRQSLHPRHSVIALHRSETAKLLPDAPHDRPLVIERDGATISQAGVTHLPYGEPRNRYRRSDFPPTRLAAQDNPSLRNAIGHIDSLVVTTKAFAVRTVMRKLRNNLSRDSTVVLLHNGMGVYETLLEDVYPDPNDRPNFIFCSNTHGLYSKGFLHSVHSAVGNIRFGIVPDTFSRDYEASYTARKGSKDAHLSLDDIANVSSKQHISPRYLNLRNTIAALTHASGLQASWEPFHNVHIAMRSKLVINAFVNPVSALLQCSNGHVLDTEYGQNIADSVCTEAERIFRNQWTTEVQAQLAAHKSAEGGEFEPTPFPRELHSKAMRREIERVVESTKNNYSSMYMDLMLRRPTEIDYINGYLVHMGKLHRFQPIMNMSLMHLVKMRGAIPHAAMP